MKRILSYSGQSAIFCLFFTFLFSVQLAAQAPEPPMPIEAFFGNRQLYFQLVVKQKFAPDSKLGFFTVATFTSDYKPDAPGYRIVMPVQFNYSIGKGFGLMAGADVNSAVGVAPIVGPQHNYASRQFLAATVVSFFLNEGKDLKLFGLYEYKPPLNEQWTLFNRIQLIYNYSLAESVHNRSYLYLRSGLKKEQITFGLAANLDQFGPLRIYQENYGVFVRWEFR